jgi:hygromycin-B 4-O-kinase
LATRADAEDAHREFLHDRFGPAAQIAVMRPGEWSTAYSVRSGNADLVVRFGAYDEDFEKDAYAARYSSQDLPVPPILEWGPALGGFFAIAPRMHGEHIDGLDEARMRRVLPSLFAALDAMRVVELVGPGYGGWRANGSTSHSSWRHWLLGFIDEPATRGAPGWRELLRDLPTAVRSFEEGYERLVRLADGCPEVRHLFHDDLINRNVLVDGDHISAVLDWGSSKYGDFVYDIANLVFYRPWFPQWQGIDFAAEALEHYERIGLAVPQFAERIKCYSLRIALDGIAYSAFRKRWDEVRLRSRRALEIAREPDL